MFLVCNLDVLQLGQWVNKLWYIQTMKYYPIIFTFSTKKEMNYTVMKKTWRSLKCILLNTRNQSERAVSCILPTILHSRKGKNMEK